MQDTDSLLETPRTSSITPDLIAVRNILLATDFSECSTRALSHALGIASRYESRLHLFHCVDPRPYNLADPAAIQAACDDAQRDLERLVSDLRRQAGTRNVEITIGVSAGDLTHLLANAVKDHNVDLMVVGTHGRTGWRKAVLGSVAEVVMEQSCCPVLSVGRFVDRTRIQDFGLESILLVCDVSVPSQLAESYAISLARVHGSQLNVVELLHDGGGRVLGQMSGLEWSERALRNLGVNTGLTVPAQMPIDIGAQSDLILQVADQTAADLIVLVVPATHKLTDRFLSTNSYRVICGARCPVLTVHAQ